MSVIFTERIGEKWRIFCEECHRPLDTVSSTELVGMQQGEFTPVLCFDCDGGADEIPDILYSDKGSYMLIINGVNIAINPWRETELSTRRFNQWEEMYKGVMMTEKETEEYDG